MQLLQFLHFGVSVGRGAADVGTGVFSWDGDDVMPYTNLDADSPFE